MARMNSVVGREFDAELELEDGAAAMTTVGDNVGSGVLDLQALTAAYWDNDELAINEEFIICVLVSALDTAGADETYDLEFEVDSVNTFDDAAVVVQEFRIPATGYYEFAVSRQLIAKKDDDAAYGRLVVRTTGATVSITFTAWAAPSRAH